MSPPLTLVLMENAPGLIETLMIYNFFSPLLLCALTFFCLLFSFVFYWTLCSPLPLLQFFFSLSFIVCFAICRGEVIIVFRLN